MEPRAMSPTELNSKPGQLTAEGRCPTCNRLLATWTEARRNQHLARCIDKVAAANDPTAQRRRSKRLTGAAKEPRPEPSLKSILRRAADEDLQTALALSRSAEAARKAAAREAEEARRAVASVPSVYRITPEARRERLLAAVAQILRPLTTSESNEKFVGVVRSDLWRLTSLQMQPLRRYLVPDLLVLLPGVVSLANKLNECDNKEEKAEAKDAATSEVEPNLKPVEPVADVVEIVEESPADDECIVSVANQPPPATSMATAVRDSLASDYLSMVDSSVCADLHFLTESDGLITPAHRFVFAARCSATNCLQRFNKALDSEGRVLLSNVSRAELLLALQCIYGGVEEPQSCVAKQLLSSWRFGSSSVEKTETSTKKRRSGSVTDCVETSYSQSSQKRPRLDVDHPDDVCQNSNEDSTKDEDSFGLLPEVIVIEDDCTPNQQQIEPTTESIPKVVDNEPHNEQKSDANNSSCCDLFANVDDCDEFDVDAVDDAPVNEAKSDDQQDEAENYPDNDHLSGISVPACDHLYEASFFDQPSPMPEPPASETLTPVPAPQTPIPLTSASVLLNASRTPTSSTNDAPKVAEPKSIPPLLTPLPPSPTLASNKQTAKPSPPSLRYRRVSSQPLPMTPNLLQPSSGHASTQQVSEQNQERQQGQQKFRFKTIRGGAGGGAGRGNRGRQRSPSPFTPMRDYDASTTPELAESLRKYGVRPLPRRKAVLLLKDIYKQLHQYESGPE